MEKGTQNPKGGTLRDASVKSKLESPAGCTKNGKRSGGGKENGGRNSVRNVLRQQGSLAE